VQAQASRYADTAALFQALGGGWWHAADSGQAEATPAPPRISDSRQGTPGQR
jgi:hypothetical protein